MQYAYHRKEWGRAGLQIPQMIRSPFPFQVDLSELHFVSERNFVLVA